MRATGRAAYVASATGAFTDNAAATLSLTLTRPSACSAAKLEAVSRIGRRLLASHARDERRPDASRLAEALAAAERRLVEALNRLDAGADCQVRGNGAQVAERLRIDARRLRDLVGAYCGDGNRQGREACDGLDAGACFGACGADCRCAAATCGNGQLDPGEFCDGAAPCQELFAVCAGCTTCCHTSVCSTHPILPDLPAFPCCSGTCVHLPGMPDGVGIGG